VPEHTFRLNGEQVTVEAADDERLLWVLRDILGVTGPKYGCGINVCKACTSHLNGRAANPCAIPVGDLRPTDEVTTIEGLPATVGADLHPMQEAWLDQDVAQCGYCQPGQIMAAVALVRRVKEEGPRDLGGRPGRHPQHLPLRHTYPRIREAIRAAAGSM
jgi:isoquinoline 1-oxidoreductase alpha subunit